ncbi:energy-coupling factor transport system ATP-binding protein [Paenibacillus castaneae]|uniref:ATP-binding cassette domain-containing protein n=1 Tax=Paenibacillus castaneae TaxID=474957 RepID=UPI000C9C9119|nr:ATP-binding cassette domain-containing protein [Paenibacillus castaneae]NIK75534.1 energy-coupling factor transport system ATP-binding protein [Paenibacillus castaneae]
MNNDWKLNGVSVSTGGTDKKQLLKDVHMTFKAGQITLLIGRNGAGKSTLLETMAGLRHVDEGAITLGDAPLWLPNRRKQKLNRHVALQYGISLQSSESQWFASTVREELLYSLKPYKVDEESASKRKAKVLAEVGLPLELLERDPWTLSGGQQRRLSLACLLACEPDWLLLDEPTAGLDAVGIRRLCAVLEAHRAAGRGAVVATHDLDALLPLADAVAVVSGGVVREAAAAAAVAQSAAAPQALRALAELRAEAAMPPQVSAPLGSGAPWPAPQEVAAAIAAELHARPRRETEAEAEKLTLTRKELQLADSMPADEIVKELSSAHAGAELLRSDKFDPRALVIVYMMLATSVLAQNSVLEVALSAIISLLLLIPFRKLIRPWMGAIRAYLIMIAIFSFIGGIAFGPLSFDWEKVWPIWIRFSKLLLIMLLGMPMLKLMTPLRLQRAIEQTLGWLKHLKVPIHSFALIVTLIFRFIPLLTGEWERFAKLAHARGKASSSLRTIPISMFHAILIPYVRSILRLAEQMADALEARGFGLASRKPVYGFRLRFSRSDAKLIGIAAIGSLLIFLIAALL